MRRLPVLLAALAALGAAPVLAHPGTTAPIGQSSEALNPQPLPPRWSAPVVAHEQVGQPAVARPVAGQKTGIIIVGGKPVMAERAGIIVQGGQPVAAQRRGIIVQGSKPLATSAPKSLDERGR